MSSFKQKEEETSIGVRASAPPYIEEHSRLTMCLHLNSPESILIRKLPKIRLKLVSPIVEISYVYVHSFGLPENEKRFFLLKCHSFIL